MKRVERAGRSAIVWALIAFWAIVGLVLLSGCGGGGDDDEQDDQLQCATVSERGSHAHGICPEPLQ